VEECALLLANVHEGGLDAGQDSFDPAEVDVPDGAPMVGPIDEKLDQAVVFEDGQAGFPLAPVDENLALQLMTSAAAERHHALPHPIAAARWEMNLGLAETRRPEGGPDKQPT